MCDGNEWKRWCQDTVMNAPLAFWLPGINHAYLQKWICIWLLWSPSSSLLLLFIWFASIFSKTHTFFHCKSKISYQFSDEQQRHFCDQILFLLTWQNQFEHPFVYCVKSFSWKELPSSGGKPTSLGLLLSKNKSHICQIQIYIYALLPKLWKKRKRKPTTDNNKGTK